LRYIVKEFPGDAMVYIGRGAILRYCGGGDFLKGLEDRQGSDGKLGWEGINILKNGMIPSNPDAPCQN